MSQLYSVLKVSSLPPANQPDLSNFEKENEQASYGYDTVGGILLNTKYIWTSNGGNFKVINTKLGLKVAAWSFGFIIKDFSTTVVCVDELHRPNGKLPLLIVGLDCEIGGGIICVFDITNSKVLRAIQIEEKLTNLHVIDTNQSSCPLPGPLRAFDGILSVGTIGGNVLLIDLCCQIYEEILGGCNYNDIRDETNSCHVKTIFLDNINSLESYKQSAVRNGEHLCIHLNSTFNEDVPHFILKGPKGDDRIHVNKLQVQISALHYCSQLGSVLVGYNFGAWQLWDLINLKLLYTSPIYEENTPVAHFAIQEPCDDPRSFCYVWAVYSNTEMYQTGTPIAVLYSLNYGAKEWHEGYGVLYQDLISCTVRFQTDLKLFHSKQSSNTLQGSYCLRLQAVTKTVSKGSPVQDHHEDTFALCYIIWNEWKSQSDNVNISKTYLCLFDLNQWYKEQMPSSSNLEDNETYMSSICLTDLINDDQNTNAMLDVLINTNTLNQFIGSLKLEEHYYPTSLAFELCSLRENDFIFYKKEACQRYLLSQLELGGPLSIINPTHFYQQCIDVGLIPLFLDGAPDITPTHDYQREVLLSIALEQQLLGYLCKCAAAWSNGSYSASGSTLYFLLTWGWQRALVVKKQANVLSIPLFDYSGFRLDSNTHSLLSNCGRQLNNLTALFEYAINKFSLYLLNADEIKKQWQSLQMVSIHLEVLLWLLNVGLLPESPLSTYPREDEFNRISAPYPVDSLIKYYTKRRNDLERLSQEKFSSGESLLFIDNLINLECGGEKIQSQWEGDGGTGIYPPSSLQALLRTYLVEDVDISYKHCVIVYVFLDLAMTLDKSRYKSITTHLIKFPAVFKLSPSIIKITQAFWHLDHEDFATAMEQLLDPLVCPEDLKMWHHRVAMKSLLAQDQQKFALHYLHIRQPPVSHVGDLCVVLSLYVANNMLEDGFSFLRQNKSNSIEELLLKYFYEECSKNNKIRSLISMPLSNFEESTFMNYLLDSKHPMSRDLQLLYYIQHGRYMNAYESNEKFLSTKGQHRGLMGMSAVSYPEYMIKAFVGNLSDISQNLINVCHKEKDSFRKTVSRPEPFSVFLHKTNKEANYKSTMIHTILSKAKETWQNSTIEVENPDLTNHVELFNCNEMPFVNTPKATSLSSGLTRTPVIFPKIIKLKKDEEVELAPPPTKKFKSSTPELDKSSVKLLDTPIIKRKRSSRSNAEVADESFAIKTPQSILKNHSISEALLTLTTNYQEREIITPIASNFHPSKKTSWGLKPRSSIGHTPRPAVRFDISKELSDSSTSDNESLPAIIKETAIIHSAPSEKNVKAFTTSDSKTSSLTTDTDVYYSLKSSTSNNETENINEQTGNAINISGLSRSKKRHLDTISETTTSSSFSITTRLTAQKLFGSPIVDKTLQDQKISESREIKSSSKVKSRRAISRFLHENVQSTPDRTLNFESTSPNLSFPSLLDSDCNIQDKSFTDHESPLRSTGKASLKGRRSLSRKVLEFNTRRSVGGASFNESLSSSRLSFPSMLDNDSTDVMASEEQCTSSVTDDVNQEIEIVEDDRNSECLANPVLDPKPLQVNPDVNAIKVSASAGESVVLTTETDNATSSSYIEFPSTLDFEQEMDISYCNEATVALEETHISESDSNAHNSDNSLENQTQESPIVLESVQELQPVEPSEHVVEQDSLTLSEQWDTSHFSFPSMLEADTDEAGTEVPENIICVSSSAKLNTSEEKVLPVNVVDTTSNFTLNTPDVAPLSDTCLQFPTSDANVVIDNVVETTSNFTCKSTDVAHIYTYLEVSTSDGKMSTDDIGETNIYDDLSNDASLPITQTNENSADDLYLDNAAYLESSRNDDEASKLNNCFYEKDGDIVIGETVNANLIPKEDSNDCEIIELDDSSSDKSDLSRSSIRKDQNLDSSEASYSDEESLENRQGQSRRQKTISESSLEEQSSSESVEQIESESESEKRLTGGTLNVIHEEELISDSQSGSSSSNKSIEKRSLQEEHQQSIMLDIIPEEPNEIEEIDNDIVNTKVDIAPSPVNILDTTLATTSYLDDSKLLSVSYIQESSLCLGTDLKTSIPARRSRRLSSLQSSTPSDTLSISKRTRRSSSVTGNISTSKIPSNEATPTSSKKVTEPVLTTRGIKTRRASDDVKQKPLKKRILRSASADIEISTPPLTVTIEDYASSRRLTRRQANLLEKTLNSTTNIDVSLVEKCSEGGKTENTQSTTLSKPLKRKLRSNSAVSNVSSESNTFSEIGSLKNKNNTKSKTTGLTTRKTRSQSVDISLLQDVPDSKPNLRRTRQSSKDQDASKSDIVEPETRVSTRRKRALSETLDHTISRTQTKTLGKGKSKNSDEDSNTSIIAVGKRRTRNASSSK